ncbi:AAA domain-containing protein [Achromobacter deleyi]|nr:AAA domain-containing protein [Achromobacter deleyi]
MESIFEQARSNQDILALLQSELNYRKTERATQLANLIRESMAPQREISTAKTSPAQNSPENQPSSQPTKRKIQPQRSQPITPANLHGARPVPAQPTASARFPTRRVSPTDRRADDPVSIIEAWTAMEALSPQTYRQPADLANGDARCIAQLDQDLLPWQRDEKSRPNYQLFYQVVFGAIDMEVATEALTQTYGAEEERSARTREKSAIAAVLVDRIGNLVQEKGVAISSFAWALPVALEGDITRLGEWADLEERLVKDFTEHLVEHDKHGEPLPMSRKLIDDAFKWLVERLQIPADFYQAPKFSFRVYHYYKAKNPPEVSLLNSFYLNDLARIRKLVAANEVTPALARYIGLQSVGHSSDLLSNRDLIEELIAPKSFPQARWPAPGGHSLVTLQQAAVNATRSSIAQTPGIAAVNGPPGTGKTTLLRDIVAACVMDRATAMARFDDPTLAFETTGIKIPAGDRAFFHLYRIDSSLRGHEIIVASSNNKAVENVSRELPSSKAIGRDFQYFKTISDRLNTTRAEQGTKPPEETTWGLIAAVLGNAENRSAFQQTIWFDPDYSLRIYLKAAKGDSVIREVRDSTGKLIRREIPIIVTKEAPPSPEQARTEWAKTRRHFQTLKNELDRELSHLEAIRQECLKLPNARHAVTVAQQAHQRDQAAYERLSALTQEIKSQLTRAEHALRNAEASEQTARSSKPWWLHRIFNTCRYRDWEVQYAPLVEKARDLRNAVAQSRRDYLAAQSASDEAELKHALSHQALETRLHELERLQLAIADHKENIGKHLVGDDFFSQGHEAWNLATPWIPPAIQGKREELFEASMALHRAFINVNAQRVSHNFGALMGAMQAGAFQDPAKLALLGDLWTTLFLICPVVSTTFASVDRMLGDLPPASFGWLLLDEAGQATPQAAAGAMMRAQRAVVVGDPLQIPPVVSLPTMLTEQIAKHFNINNVRWLAPDASAQTLADEASYHRAEFQASAGTREVGLPLLVHRRCQDPMFRIANDIAYDGQMVHAAGRPSISKIVDILGEARWFDVDGTGDSKWCPAEGKLVLDLLHRLSEGGVTAPDIYIITPFRIVANELRQLLRQEEALFKTFNVDMNAWLKERVGTIHTFQGKEAEAVIAVLGAPMKAQQGARSWATSTPNILNVMVSRAKRTMYVVGSRTSWSTSGHGRTMAKFLDSHIN